MAKRYIKITTSIGADGLGVPSVSVFMSICDKKKVTGSFCEGCHNDGIQNKNLGFPMTVDEAVEIIRVKLSENKAMFGRSCVSIMGGEPLSSYNRDFVNGIAKELKEESVVVYTWRRVKDIKKEKIEVSNYSKIVCGEYLENMIDPNYILGSTNQYVIDNKFKKIIYYKRKV